MVVSGYGSAATSEDQECVVESNRSSSLGGVGPAHAGVLSGHVYDQGSDHLWDWGDHLLCLLSAVLPCFGPSSPLK